MSTNELLFIGENPSYKKQKDLGHKMKKGIKNPPASYEAGGFLFFIPLMQP